MAVLGAIGFDYPDGSVVSADRETHLEYGVAGADISQQVVRKAAELGGAIKMPIHVGEKSGATSPGHPAPLVSKRGQTMVTDYQ